MRSFFFQVEHCFQRHSVWLICVLSFVAMGSAAKGDVPDSQVGLDYFEKHVRPLLVEHCYRCHSERFGKREAGLLLDRREGWAQGGDSGPAIHPGDVDASPLILAVRKRNGKAQMPPEGSLPDEAIAQLEHWVRIGAPDPRDATSTESRRGSDPSDPIAGREHWAFRPLSTRRPRATEAIEWPRSTVDNFTLEGLQAANLRPSVDAARVTMARRMSIQLIGLLPTPEFLSEFLQDDRPDSTERLADALLASPQYGQRWGRHWLDLARYADSNGLDENFLFREAWRYRNWVISAINADRPFDDFLLQQIAGDLLPYDSIEQRDSQRIAAGFLVIGPKVLLGNADANQRMEIADEQMDTIGRAILGQTFGCARCHDHKFDPIPTTDYYAMAGIFTSTQVMEQRYMLGEQRVMERLVGLGNDGDEADRSYEQYWRERPKLVERHKQAQSALEILEKGDTTTLGSMLQNLLEQQPGSVADTAADSTQSIELRTTAQKELLASLRTAIDQPPKIPPRAMVPCDREAPGDEYVRIAGQFDRQGERVRRGFLRAVGESTTSIPEAESGRIELARWLTDTVNGAGQLSARVLTNRIWQHLIGRGIVATVDNFGRTGERPSHPELLDNLATEMIDSGWSIKRLIRTVVLSRTFAMSSHHDESAHAVDPENRLLWRAHRRRLEAEVLRDLMLSAAGELDARPMDSTVWYLGDQATAVGDNKVRRRTDFPNRSIYLPIIRNDLPELFSTFDFADPHSATGRRPDTMVATQGLFMLNDESVMAAAKSLARRVLADANATESGTRIDMLFRLLFDIPAPEADRSELSSFVEAMKMRLTAEGEAEAELESWTMTCHALIASSRFQVMD